MRKIILMTGPPGSGKSTIAVEIAKKYPKSIHIQVDHPREMMVSGIEIPSGGWNEETGRQFQMARSSATQMAQIYAEQGVVVIIDDVSVPDDFQSQYAALFEDPDVQRILLLPNANALIERMRKRGGPWEEALIKEVPWFYNYLDPMPKDGWIVLETGDWPIEKTVDEVLSAIGE